MTLEASSVLILGEIGEEQVLAQDVLTAGGQTLLRQGTLLTPKIHQMLMNRGYTEVEVLASAPGMTAQEIGARLDAMFESNESTPSMLKLRALFERYHLRGRQSEQGVD